MPTNVSPPITLEHAIGQYHSLAALLPIILFTAALICDLVHSFGNRKAFIIAHWLIIAGVVACMPTILTGLEAAKYFKPENEFLATHRWLGFATGITTSFYAGLRISSMIWELPISKKWYLVMSILVLALVSWTSDYGVLLNTQINSK